MFALSSSEALVNIFSISSSTAVYTAVRLASDQHAYLFVWSTSGGLRIRIKGEGWRGRVLGESCSTAVVV